MRTLRGSWRGLLRAFAASMGACPHEVDPQSVFCKPSVKKNTTALAVARALSRSTVARSRPNEIGVAPPATNESMAVSIAFWSVDQVACVVA